MTTLSRAISPAALSLQLFAIALAGGPLILMQLLGQETESYPYMALVVILVAGTVWNQIAIRTTFGRLEPAQPVAEGRPVAGGEKLVALLMIEEPSGIRSLTGRSVVAISPATGNPVLRDLERPKRLHLWAPALPLLGAAVLWTLGITWAARALVPRPFLGLVVAVLGSGGALLTLLHRNGWGAGSYALQVELEPEPAPSIESAPACPAESTPLVTVWAAPLIPSQGTNRFRAIVALDGRILVRPDVLRAPYLRYLLAHEQAHVAAKSFRLVWLEQSLSIALLLAAGLAIATFGWSGFVPLLLLPLLRLLLCRLSYQSEMAADLGAVQSLGVEPCLAALAIIGLEARPTSLPRWQRYSPTIDERIDHLRQRFSQPEV